MPLSLRGAVLGLVSLYRCGAAEPFDEDDVTLAVAAATRAALAIDNARRFEREHVIASTVQRRLLPQAAREQAAVETAHVLLPGRDSGCWYDTIALAGARTALVVGRVEGEGLQTAIVMGQLRTVIQALADLDLEPEEVLARLKDTADRLAEERDSLPPADVLQREPLSAGCLYGVYDPFARTCTVARAGHPAPIVVGPDGRAVPFDVPEGPGLFSDDSALFAPAVVTLDVGSLLAFCTADLLTGDRAAERIAETLSRPGRTLRQAGDDVVYALPADTRAGGAALLLARTGTVSDHKVATWDLSQERRAPATARALVRDRFRSGAWTRTPSRRRSSSSANWSPTPSATAPRRCGCASCSTPRSPARSTTVPPPPRTCGTRGPSTRAAGACSSSPASPPTGEPATAPTARCCGPNRTCRAARRSGRRRSGRPDPAGTGGGRPYCQRHQARWLA